MKNDEVLVDVQNVSKRFCKDFKRSIRYGFMDSLRALAGKDMDAATLRKDEFWAVKDISFQLRRGECLGLIGHNGAGKSTLLKMLNGLITPDHGKIVMRGKIGALIELGAGFSAILTGRENIYNNAAVLGFSKKEIDARFQDIIDFSEIGEFLDMPVQNYSSGMKVRLGFAVASFLNPDILLVDEVLAVGDLGFILKCFKQIDEILPHTALIFVSHSMPMIARICNHIILIDHGNAEYYGQDVAQGIDLYYRKFSNNNSYTVIDTGLVEIVRHSITKKEIAYKDDLNLCLVLNFKDHYPDDLVIYIEFKDKEQRPIAGSQIRISHRIQKGAFEVNIAFEKLFFSKGLYAADLGIYNYHSKTPIYRINNLINFQVIASEQMWVPFLLENNYTFERLSND